jgi:hypothetical protein
LSGATLPPAGTADFSPVHGKPLLLLSWLGNNARQKENLMRLVLIVSLVTAALFTIGCSTPKGTLPSEKAASIQLMHDESMPMFIERHPEIRDLVAKSYGYALLSRDNLTIWFVGFGGGYGVAVEKSTGKRTYLKDAHINLDLGFDFRDYRSLLIFNNPTAFKNFITGSWDCGVNAEVALTSRDRWFEDSAENTFLSGVTYYEFTDSGGALRLGLPLYNVTPWTELNAAAPTAKPAAR